MMDLLMLMLTTIASHGHGLAIEDTLINVCNVYSTNAGFSNGCLTALLFSNWQGGFSNTAGVAICPQSAFRKLSTIDKAFRPSETNVRGMEHSRRCAGGQAVQLFIPAYRSANALMFVHSHGYTVAAAHDDSMLTVSPDSTSSIPDGQSQGNPPILPNAYQSRVPPYLWNARVPQCFPCRESRHGLANGYSFFISY